MASKNDKKILIVGPGALGGYFAARIGQKFRQTWVLDSRASRASQLQERGFHVTGATLLDWVPADGRVSDSCAGWPEMDVIFFFVKAPSLKVSAAACARVTGRNTVWVLLQNGWGAEDTVKHPRSSASVVIGFTDEAATLESAGRVFHAASGPTVLDAGAKQAKAVAAVLEESGFDCRLEKNFDKHRWMKLLVNACVNPVGALADVANGRLAEKPLSEIVDRALGECLKLSALDRRKVAPDEARRRVADVVQRTAANRNSLWQDIVRRRPTEREFLLGPFLEIARRKKTPAPTLAFLDRLIRGVETFSGEDR